MRSDRPRLLLRDTACLLVLALLVATTGALTVGVQGSGTDMRCVSLAEACHHGMRTAAPSSLERAPACGAYGHLGRLPEPRTADAAPAAWRLLDMPPPAR